MKSIEVKGTARTIAERSSEQARALKAIRKDNGVPCVLYGAGENVHFTVPAEGLRNLVYTPHIYVVDLIADRCTLTGSDIKAVLDALMVVIKRNLANGSPVRLGDLGSFRPSVSGKGTEDASKCGASSVKKARVIYVPSAEIKEAVSMYSFSKAGASAANEDGEGGDEKPNPKPDEGGGEAPDPAA